MSPTTLTGVQFTFSTVLLVLVAKWDISPALSTLLIRPVIGVIHVMITRLGALEGSV